MCLLWVTAIGYILLVERMGVSAFYPASVKVFLDKGVPNDLVGVDYQAFGLGVVAAYEYAGHAFAYTVLYAVS